MRGLLLQLVVVLAVLLVVSNAKKAKRKEPKQPQCCRCVQEKVGCSLQSKLGRGPRDTGPQGPKQPKVEKGLNCNDDVDCQIFGFENCDKPNCILNGTKVTNLAELVDLRDNDKNCIFDEVLCCDPVDEGLLSSKLPLLGTEPNGVASVVDFKAICDGDEVAATEDFEKGKVCGKRDSRSYKHVDLEPSFTNPGEWPWVVLIYGATGYIGAGTLVAKDTVVTVAHKMRNVTAKDLKVRLGDWNPQSQDGKEKFPFVELKVACIRIHPKSVVETIENNVAVLRLVLEEDTPATVLGVVTLYTADRFLDSEERQKVEDEEDNDDDSELVVRTVDGAKGEAPSYINNICLPESPTQFAKYMERCWVVAWGQNLMRQREVDLPLVPAAECEARLKPTFTQKGVPDWKLKASDLCAGGEPGKDACVGEGGAPLVCLDKQKNQFFAVGLVGYGFGCNSTLPAVYTNLQDPTVKDFITKAMDDANLCAGV